MQAFFIFQGTDQRANPNLPPAVVGTCCASIGIEREFRYHVAEHGLSTTLISDRK